jgi:hypothetical protein
MVISASLFFVQTIPAVGPCLELEKRVSGDGGLNFFDADNCSDADVPFTTDDSVYELEVTNCGREAVVLDGIIDDDLQINLVLNPTVTIPPGDTVTFTNNAGQTQGLLQKEGACPNTDGEFDNTATVFGTGAGSNLLVEATDPACVKCGPCIDLLKEVSVDGGTTWFDANDEDCLDGPTTQDPAEYRLIIENCGGETLVDVVIDDDVLGIDNVPVDNIPVSGSIILTKADLPALAKEDLCPLTPGDSGVPDDGAFLRNIARVDAEGQISGIPVFDEDPACVKCDEDGDGVLDNVDVCPGTIIPESIPTKRLGTNRFALVDEDTVFDTKAPNGKGPQKTFTTVDTGGCSCEQIIEELGLGKGHVKFGCSISAMEEWVDAVNP